MIKEVVKTLKIISADDPDFETLRASGKVLCGSDINLGIQRANRKYYARRNPQKIIEENQYRLTLEQPIESFKKNRLLAALGYINLDHQIACKKEIGKNVYRHSSDFYPDIWMISSKQNKQQILISETGRNVYENFAKKLENKILLKSYQQEVQRERIIFHKVINDEGESFYRYLGVFMLQIDESSTNYGVKWVRIRNDIQFEHIF